MTVHGPWGTDQDADRGAYCVGCDAVVQEPCDFAGCPHGKGAAAMSETKFTKGPWHVIEHSWSDVGVYAGDNRVVLLSILHEATEDNQQELERRDSANAHLIAAAPCLYAFVEKLRQRLDEGVLADAAGESYGLLLEAEALVAKARGEA